MKLSGTEMLIKVFANHNVDTIFGYPGACVISILDKLFNHDEIKQILVRHEQGAVHAACGYAQLSNKPGVVIVTSGPGATNTITGVADAFYSEVPLVVITGQVSSGLIGTDAFQEVDMLSITAPITKWNYQIRNADEMASTVERAFVIAMADPPGVVLLDITKDAQTGMAEYISNNTQLYKNKGFVKSVLGECQFPRNEFYTEILKCLSENGREMVLVIDKVPNDFFDGDNFCFNKVIKSDIYGVSGFGLPAAIGAQYAAPGKTICLVAGTLEFQATAKELGVIKQQGLDIKIILLDETAADKYKIKNPDFLSLANAYDIESCKISKSNDLNVAIQKMLNSNHSYLLQITT